MKEIGKIYSLRSLFSEEEKREHKQSISKADKFDEIIGRKIEKLMKDLNDTPWKMVKIKDNSNLKYYIEYTPSTGKYRRPISMINNTGTIFVYGDKKLEEFLLNYQ